MDVEAASKGKTGVGVNSMRVVKMYGSVNGITVLEMPTTSTNDIAVVWSAGMRVVVGVIGVMGISRTCNVVNNGTIVIKNE